jgi:hypothetical protein
MNLLCQRLFFNEYELTKIERTFWAADETTKYNFQLHQWQIICGFYIRKFAMK